MLFPQGIVAMWAKTIISTVGVASASNADNAEAYLIMLMIGIAIGYGIGTHQKPPPTRSSPPSPPPEPSPEEKERQKASKYGEDFLESVLVQKLAQQVKQQISNDSTIIGIQVKCSQLVLEHRDRIDQTIISYVRLGCNKRDLDEIMPIACALKIKIGNCCHLCCNSNGKPTSRLTISPAPLKNPNPPKPKS